MLPLHNFLYLLTCHFLVTPSLMNLNAAHLKYNSFISPATCLNAERFRISKYLQKCYNSDYWCSVWFKMSVKKWVVKQNKLTSMQVMNILYD